MDVLRNVRHSCDETFHGDLDEIVSRCNGFTIHWARCKNKMAVPPPEGAVAMCFKHVIQGVRKVLDRCQLPCPSCQQRCHAPFIHDPAKHSHFESRRCKAHEDYPPQTTFHFSKLPLELKQQIMGYAAYASNTPSQRTREALEGDTNAMEDLGEPMPEHIQYKPVTSRRGPSPIPWEWRAAGLANKDLYAVLGDELWHETDFDFTIDDTGMRCLGHSYGDEQLRQGERLITVDEFVSAMYTTVRNKRVSILQKARKFHLWIMMPLPSTPEFLYLIRSYVRVFVLAVQRCRSGSLDTSAEEEEHQDLIKLRVTITVQEDPILFEWYDLFSMQTQCVLSPLTSLDVRTLKLSNILHLRKPGVSFFEIGDLSSTDPWAPRPLEVGLQRELTSNFRFFREGHFFRVLRQKIESFPLQERTLVDPKALTRLENVINCLTYLIRLRNATVQPVLPDFNSDGHQDNDCMANVAEIAYRLFECGDVIALEALESKVLERMDKVAEYETEAPSLAQEAARVARDGLEWNTLDFAQRGKATAMRPLLDFEKMDIFPTMQVGSGDRFSADSQFVVSVYKADSMADDVVHKFLFIGYTLSWLEGAEYVSEEDDFHRWVIETRNKRHHSARSDLPYPATRFGEVRTLDEHSNEPT